MLKINTYNREASMEFALKYALQKNPEYFDYTNMGGNCTNYVSQCLYAGAPQMNFDQNGWYYLSPSNTSISWANVEPFYNFIISNQSVGPYGKISPLEMCQVGDIIQLKFENMNTYSHSLFVSKIIAPTFDDIYICANTSDERNRKLSSYRFSKYRLIHILGYRTNS